MRTTPTLVLAGRPQLGAFAAKGAATCVPDETLDDSIVDIAPLKPGDPKPSCEMLRG